MKFLQKFCGVLLSIALILPTTTVFAATTNEAANQVYPKRVSISTESREPDYVVSFTADANGNIKYYENITPDRISTLQSSRLKDTVVGAFNFYNMGYDSSANKQAYEVQMTATCDSTTAMTYHIFQAKPTSNKDWFRQETKHSNSLNIADAIYYEYTGTGPSNPKCAVKLAITIKDGTTYNFNSTLSKPYN